MSESTVNQGFALPKSIAGPHVCSQVGKNVSSVLHAAMMEFCEARGGKLTRAEIDHVFNLVMQTNELFDIYQIGYTNCVNLKKSTPFVPLDEKFIMRFVVASYCRDAMEKVYGDESKMSGPRWKRAFIEGLTVFLVDQMGPRLSGELFGVYRRLAMKRGGSLTPVTILNTNGIIGAFKPAALRIRELVDRESPDLYRIADAINEKIERAYGRNVPCKNIVSETSIDKFASLLAHPSVANPFRNLLLKSN